MPQSVEDLIRKEADRVGIPASLALAVAEQESGFNPTLVNPEKVGDENAVGTFQFLPSTAKARGIDPYNHRQNITGGVTYLQELLQKHNGNIEAVLKEYGGVKNNTTYVPEVRARLNKFEASGSADRSSAMRAGPAASLPKGSILPTRPDVVSDTVPEKPSTAIPDTVTDFAKGFGSRVAKTVFSGGDLIRRKLGMERVITRPEVQAAITPPDSVAGKTGAFAEDVAEFAIPSNLISKGRKALKVGSALVRAGLNPAQARVAAAGVEGAAQALSAYSQTKVRGDEGAETAGIIAGISPVASAAVTNLAPLIKAKALEKMEKVLSRGVTGDITPYVEKNLAQAAKDLIDLPLQRTWVALRAATKSKRDAAGQTLKGALDGPLGDVLMPKQPVVDALDELVQKSAKHLTPVKGGLATVTYNKPIVKAVQELKDTLAQYGDDIPARHLHDLKSTWDSAVFPIREAGQPVASIAEQLTTAQKKARMAGANAIREALSTSTQRDAKRIAALDRATAHAIKLDQMVKNLARRAPNFSPAASLAIRAAGGSAGSLVGSAFGHSLMGIHLGYATGALLEKAISSPAWRMATPVMRSRLADAILDGNAELVRKLVTPILVAGVQGEKEPEAAGAR